MRYPAIALLCCLALTAPSRLSAQEEEHHHHGGDTSDLGTVVFPTSCPAASQKPFERAVALMHSFQYTESEKAFQEIVANDKHCAMAHWGEAMALYHQLWDNPDAKTLKAGRKDLQQARKTKPRTERETQFIDAALQFFDTNRKLDHDARARRYSDAMASLHEKYPADPEAATFYSLSLLTWEPPNDKNETNRRKAIAVLDKVVEAEPNHPGAVGSLLSLSYADAFGSGASWPVLDTVTLTNPPQLYLDLSDPMPSERFYRVWQTNAPAVLPALDLTLATEVTLTGAIGSQVRIDCINSLGPTDAWVTLDTVTLTNTTQPYLNLTMFRQPPRLYRLVPVP